MANPSREDEILDHERQLIGKLLVQPEWAGQIKLPLAAFSSVPHQIIYQAIVNIHHQGHRCDSMPDAICKALSGRVKEIGGVAYLQRLCDQAAVSVAPTYEAEQLSIIHQRRQSLAAITAMVKACEAGEDPTGILNSTTAKLKTLQVFPVGATIQARDRDNFGTVVEDNGETCVISFTSREGVTVEKELPKSQLTLLTGAADPKAPVEPESIGRLMVTHPDLEPERIYGLLRRGEVGNIVAAPKVGKTFLVHDLALSAAFGFPWLNFPVERGRVALFDFELHKSTICFRLRKLAECRGLDLSTAGIDVFSLRGKGLDLLTLDPTMQAIKEKYSYLIVDAWYRAIPPGMDENSNSDMTALYNRLDAYAGQTGATVVVVHHSSKGSQGSKSVTDTGSGAGAQSRAVDCHLVIREHEAEGGFVVDAACRSFAPIKPFCIRKDFPIWQRADDLDPTHLKRDKPQRQKADGSPAEPITAWTAERFVEELVTNEPRTQKHLEALARDAGITERHTKLLISQIREQKLCHYEEGRGRKPSLFSRQPIPTQKQGELAA